MMPRLIAAPLQGYTDAPYRHFHAEIFGGVDLYCAPFSRIEKGAMRPRDIRDLTSPLNANHRLLPQAIFNSADELSRLLDEMESAGLTEVDLNLGCPFPPQVRKGRGAALIGRPEVLAQVARLIADRPAMSFSAKMRLGTDDPRQWRAAIGQIDAMPLRWLTVHPRVAAQQYGGELFLDEFSALKESTRHKIVFNGDIDSPQAYRAVVERYPGLEGVMIGRGLLARPWLAAQIADGTVPEEAECRSRVLELHDRLLDHYSETLCGDAQILMKIKPFWDYLEPLTGHRAAKALRKASTMAKYRAAVNEISNQQ